MDTVISDKLSPEAIHSREDLITALCSDPCIARFDYSMRTYLLTDFSKICFGYNICQPDTEITLLLWQQCATKWRVENGNFSF